MRSWQSEVLSVAPKAVWLLMSLGIVLAAEIAAALSLGFASIVLPLSFNGNGNGNLPLLVGLIFFLVVAPLAGLLVGLPTWWLFVARPRRLALRRGLFLGALSGIVAHPLVWICCLLLLSVVDVINLTPHLIGNLPLISPSSDLFLALPLSLMSLILVGWITVAVGGIAGGLLVRLQAALMRGMPQQDDIVAPPHG